MTQDPPAPPVDGLPRRKRPIARFEDVFGVAAAGVLDAMAHADDDPANQTPKVAVDIDAVGVVRNHVPVRIAHPLDPDCRVTVQCTVHIDTALPASHRGIHVSRLGDAIAKACAVDYDDLTDFAEQLCRAVSTRQYGGPTRIEVEGHVAWLEDIGGIKGKVSLEQLDLLAGCHQVGERVVRTTGIGFSHITACPCVQQTLKHTLTAQGIEPQTDAPHLTHSQRTCTTLRVSVDDAAAVVPAATLLAVADATVILTLSTLPRDQELQLVHRAHTRPQFLEDVLRLLAHGTVAALEDLPSDARIAVSSKSIESIHPYDLVGRIDCAAGDVRTGG